MDDKILQVKKELNKISKEKGYTCIERYELIKNRRKTLKKKELKVLLKEYYRDFYSYERMDDIGKLISNSFTGFGLIIAVVGFLFNNATNDTTLILKLLFIILCVVIVFTCILSWSQRVRSKNMNMIKYIIDILEEQ